MVGVDAGERRARELRLGKWTKAIREWVSTVGNGKHRKTQVKNKGIMWGKGMYAGPWDKVHMGHLYKNNTGRVCVWRGRGGYLGACGC